MELPTHPFGTEITTETVKKTMQQCRNWEDKYRQLIMWGKKLPPFDEELKSQAVNIEGCESDVWLLSVKHQNHWFFSADSNARIVKGLLAIILASFNGKTEKEIKDFDIDIYLSELNLLNHISESRSNGLISIVNKIKSIK